MKKLIFVIMLIAIFAYKKHGSQSDDSASINDVSENAIDVGHGFVRAYMPDGANPNEALVLTPINCTAEEVMMGKKLEEDLKSAGVPARRDDGFNITLSNATEKQKTMMNKSVELFQSNNPPIVFLNGYAKPRPTVDEVLAVYELTK